MFLVNWLASSTLFDRIGGVLPVDSQAASRDQSIGKTLTREDELKGDDLLKMGRIKFLWKKVASELGIENAEEVRFAVQKEGVEGSETSVAVWHQGSPTIVIPFSYLARTVVLDGLETNQGTHFDNREWTVWKQFIENCPDQVDDMFAYTEGYKKDFSAKKLRKLANRYGKYLSQIEFEAELAHEFGHVQARHLNPKEGIRLSNILRTIATYALPLLATVAAGVLSFALREVMGTFDLVLPLFAGLAAGVAVRTLASDAVLRRSVSYVRKQWEKEADAIAARSLRYCEGNVQLYKKDILVRIVKGEGVDAVSRRILQDAEHHPSDASRLQFFLSRLQTHQAPGSVRAVK